MKKLLLPILFLFSINAFAQDWVVTHSGDSLTGIVQTKPGGNLYIYKVIDGDTVGKFIYGFNVRKFFKEDAIKPKSDISNYSLDKRIEKIEQNNFVAGELLDKAGVNLLISPIPTIVGGSAATFFFYKAATGPNFTDAEIQTNSNSIFIGSFLIAAGCALSTYMIMHSFNKIKKAGKRLKLK
jgi:hypothetical protein